ncbi:hypothetical protein PVK06_030502 [Gossypium arboreum]|uniref:Uncharacterized protein n=1 Tax=Gossypium arboreum TaxID=29729 RepID=A0ABR0NNG2_GOSAR|nr:hypothetical protein PVK06_030502 [Gossypium arboreum]
MEWIIHSFVWGHTEKKGISLVKWEEIYKDTKKGGLDFKKIGCHNDAFLMKVGFNIVKKLNQLWVQVLKAKYKWVGKLPSVLNESNASLLWKRICRVWSKAREGIVWNIGKGLNVDFLER